ncbi:hypothetical protein PP175_25325 (plasmid) [Aneurinibacillus sp. Ricciae_BoGa-3]|uniref:hypothetical protein n=1 Tax=Aneurinibacillus sp. Ricciae_BoGa-3 TaxID=3022697 RepID=UPI00233FD571|nr:hypothetical protein [Aneurinibacillus sp. Ricciae_BoGa-3]WCK57391.1 hypothetical protein PP175_25325 [Aneurinibacillus sp. Ricciae_BoGa-3]
MLVGDKVKIIDKNDMNYGNVGVISVREEEWDIPDDGIHMVKVQFKYTEVPYTMNQLKVMR